MGFFGNLFDSDVEKATNEKNSTEDWAVIMDICDKVGNSQANSKDCLKAIIKRLNNADPHVVLKAITLLNACVNNCGKTFHLEIASRDFETEYRKLLNKSHITVQQKLKEVLKTWSEGEFKSDPQLSLIPALYNKLKSEGVDFSAPPDMASKKSAQLSKDPNVASDQQEVDDIAKAIELSLKEKSGSPRINATSSLYPSTSLGASSASTAGVPSEARKVRALYDFEAAEDNELTFVAGEIIHVIDDSDQNWWKGYNQRGEGLFPANFVSADLSAEPEELKTKQQIKKTVQFDETKQEKQETESVPQEVEINEEKIDRLIHLLHEADPSDAQQDTLEMLNLEEQVNNMGPLIDTELERVDRKHAQLTQLSSDLVEALNLYHTLMREPPFSTLPKNMPPYSNYPPHSAPPQHVPPHIMNGNLPPPGSAHAFSSIPYGAMIPGQMERPAFMSMPPGAPPSSMTLPHHFQMAPHGVVPPPGTLGRPISSMPDDIKPPGSLPPHFVPGGMPNYGPPSHQSQQPGSFPPQGVGMPPPGTTVLPPGIPPPGQPTGPPSIPTNQNYNSQSSQHMM